MHNYFYLLLIFALAGCFEKQPTTVGGISLPPALMEKADEQAFDYTGHLAKALNKENAALQSLLLFSKKIEDPATAKQHQEILHELLVKTGDGFFAETVASLSPADKNAVWPALESNSGPSMKTTAPLTWKALLPAEASEEHQGLYSFQADRSTFRDCKSPDKIYYAIDETGDIEKNYLRLLQTGYPGQAIYAEVKGFVTQYFGTRTLPANFAGFFIVTEIIELEQKNYRNTCIPYEYWALGTEPFWAAQISGMEAVIEFRGMDDESTRMFTYAKPIEEDSAKVYAAINQETGDNIRVTVRQAPCSDGMSDRVYSYTVKLAMNGKNYTGCAIAFDERNKLMEGQGQ